MMIIQWVIQQIFWTAFNLNCIFWILAWQTQKDYVASLKFHRWHIVHDIWVPKGVVYPTHVLCVINIRRSKNLKHDSFYLQIMQWLICIYPYGGDAMLFPEKLLCCRYVSRLDSLWVMDEQFLKRPL